MFIPGEGTLTETYKRKWAVISEKLLRKALHGLFLNLQISKNVNSKCVSHQAIAI
jgi:hypothetical protein